MISIVIPVFNEEKRIAKTLNAVCNSLRSSGISFEIIAVANNCQDDTVSILNEFKNTTIPELKVINIDHVGIVGNTKGYAISIGMKSAVGDYHLFMDADNATCFDHVSEFMSHIDGGYDMVISSRYVPGAIVVKKQPIYRILLSRAANLLTRVVLLPGIYDTQCGFKMFSKECSKIVFNNTTVLGWGADLEMLAIARHNGLKIKEAPVSWESQDGSTVRSHALFHTLRELFAIRSNLKSGIYKK
jgi:dolichyl-phosphate beta-glucosyltransferase